MAQRQNRWFQPKDGIAREVIQADIQRYLGRDATVRPGEDSGIQGYWITAYRTLTTEMIHDLQLDSRRWEQEITQGRERYTESATHRSRQYYGPSETPAPESTSYTQQYTQQAYASQQPAAYPADRDRDRQRTSQTAYASSAAAYGTDSAYQYTSQPQQQYMQPTAYAQQPAQYSANAYTPLATQYTSSSSYGASSSTPYATSSASQPRTYYQAQESPTQNYAAGQASYSQQPTQSAYLYSTAYPATAASGTREHVSSPTTQPLASPTPYTYAPSSQTGYPPSSRDPPRRH